MVVDSGLMVVDSGLMVVNGGFSFLILHLFSFF